MPSYKSVFTGPQIDERLSPATPTRRGTVKTSEFDRATYKSVSDMVADPGLSEGQIVRTSGYYSPGDGGGNDYEIVAAGTGVDDGGSFIDLSGSGYQARGLIHGGSVSVKAFGAVGDGVTDDWDSFDAAMEVSRSNRVKVVAPAGTFFLSQPLDISGVTFEGYSKNFAGADGTRLLFDGTDGLVQSSISATNIKYDIKKVRIDGALAALKMTYASYCNIEDFHVRDCQDGILCGDPNILGTLWNTFTRFDVRVSRYALVISGRDFSNANKFNTGYFSGGERSGHVSAGGLGAIANHFSNVEFAGPKLGIELGQNKSTYMENCYHESRGPAIKISGYTLGLDVNNPTFSHLRNDNEVGVNSFIWHSNFTCRVRLSGGYAELPNDSTTSGLSLIRSDNESGFFLDMQSLPNTEIDASGWSVFSGGLPPRNGILTYRDEYTPSTSAVSGTFDPGSDGYSRGYYHVSGRTVTVNVAIRIGSDATTTGTQFLIGLPFRSSPSSFRAHGSAVISRSGEENYLGVVQVNAGSPLCSIYLNNNTSAVGNSQPRAWQEGDRIHFTITYAMG